MAMNPVEQRIATMSTNWLDFRDDKSKRILVWQVQEDALSMVDAFVEMQKEQTDFSTGDTFLLFKTPCQYSLQYSNALKTELKGKFDASRDQLPDEGLEADWDFQPERIPDNAEGFVHSLLSFGSKYHQAIGHLVPILAPAITETKTYNSWLIDLLKQNLPEKLRLLLVQTKGSPLLDKLLEQNDPRVLIQELDINMGVLAQETFSQETTTGPAGTFRNLLMGVVTLVERGTSSQVRSKATDALNFARKQGWKDQEVVIRMLFASSLMREQRYGDATKVYRIARETAEITKKEKHPVGQKLVMQSWFAQAGAEFADEDYHTATASYDKAAIAAKEDENLPLTIEALRMAAFCLVRVDENKAALKRGERAVGIADTLPPDECPMTTIGTCLVDMMRIVDEPRVEALRQVKISYKKRLQQIQNHIEQRGNELVTRKNPDALNIVENEQQAFQEKAFNEALPRIPHHLISAPDDFLIWVQHGDRLLDEHWLLLNDIALPLPEPSEDQEPTNKEGGES